jgi:hypothetical protein
MQFVLGIGREIVPSSLAKIEALTKNDLCRLAAIHICCLVTALFVQLCKSVGLKPAWLASLAVCFVCMQ